MFRNLTWYRMPPDWLARLPDHLDQDLPALREPAPLELSTRGFVPPSNGKALLLGLDCAHWLLTAGTATRILPTSVLSRAVADRLDEIEVMSGRRPVGKEHKRLREEVFAELLPRAFVRHHHTGVWIDRDAGRVGIDTAATSIASNAIGLLRETFGSFPAIPPAADAARHPRQLLTNWLSSQSLPSSFELGNEAEMRADHSHGPVIRVRNQDLDAEEIVEHVNGGLQVSRIELNWKGRLSFVLDEHLTLRKLSYSDVVLDQLNEAENPHSELLARFTLMTRELRPLLDRLEQLFTGAKADDCRHCGGAS